MAEKIPLEVEVRIGLDMVLVVAFLAGCVVEVERRYSHRAIRGRSRMDPMDGVLDVYDTKCILCGIVMQTRNSSVENIHIYSISSAADIMEYVRAIKGSSGQTNALFERPLYRLGQALNIQVPLTIFSR